MSFQKILLHLTMCNTFIEFIRFLLHYNTKELFFYKFIILYDVFRIKTIFYIHPWFIYTGIAVIRDNMSFALIFSGRTYYKISFLTFSYCTQLTIQSVFRSIFSSYSLLFKKSNSLILCVHKNTQNIILESADLY